MKKEYHLIALLIGIVISGISMLGGCSSKEPIEQVHNVFHLDPDTSTWVSGISDTGVSDTCVKDTCVKDTCVKDTCVKDDAKPLVYETPTEEEEESNAFWTAILPHIALWFIISS